MTIEVQSVSIKNGVVSIFAIDCSEENLQRMERLRDDTIETEICFLFDTHSQNDYLYLLRWLKRQKTTINVKTWGEALTSVYGTVTSISAKFRVWE